MELGEMQKALPLTRALIVSHKRCPQGSNPRKRFSKPRPTPNRHPNYIIRVTLFVTLMITLAITLTLTMR